MDHVQSGRKLSVTTPLGQDYFLLNGFTGHEAISRLFRFQLQCIAENAKKPPFDALLGQSVTVEVTLPDKSKKYINGVCNRVSQGGRDQTFTRYLLDVVPKFWLLSRKAQSKIYQHLSVPDILKKVLAPLDFTLELQGTFEPRDYCVQYRESDYAFASRLMEEEGIFYFFKHDAGSHTMVLANSPGSHKDLPGKSSLIYESVLGGSRPEDRITNWEKAQELRSGKAVLWDECFEMPKKHLEAELPIQASVGAGKSTHKLKLGVNDKLEQYDFPGGYAQRFDGINKGGGEQPSELQKIFTDNGRTVEIRMQEEAAASVLVTGTSHVRHLVSGFKFTLERHFEGEGSWVLYQIDHVASESADVRSGRGVFSYENHFSCFPAGLPFRPPRVTPRPTVKGTQTAFVVGPPGEEIFTDKYGRIKVQFEWDRDGKYDSDSSCWIRVATPWAGKQWGAVHIPRIGQEVVVDFVEGDMDKPIVVGSVYNAEQMPPYKLPDHKTQSGTKSRSTLQGSPTNFNELRFEDKKGSEEILFHAEKDFLREVENDDELVVGHDQTITIKRDRTEQVERDEEVLICRNRTHEVDGNDSLWVDGEDGRGVAIARGDDNLLIKMGNRWVQLDMGNQSTKVKLGNITTELEMGNMDTKLEMGNQTTKADLGAISFEAMQSIELKVGMSSIKIDQMGVTIKGLMVSVEGQIQTQVKGLMTQVTADAMLELKGGITLIG